jgi:hypothetical protein
VKLAGAAGFAAGFSGAKSLIPLTQKRDLRRRRTANWHNFSSLIREGRQPSEGAGESLFLASDARFWPVAD